MRRVLAGRQIPRFLLRSGRHPLLLAGTMPLLTSTALAGCLFLLALDIGEFVFQFIEYHPSGVATCCTATGPFHAVTDEEGGHELARPHNRSHVLARGQEREAIYRLNASRLATVTSLDSLPLFIYCTRQCCAIDSKF